MKTYLPKRSSANDKAKSVACGYIKKSRDSKTLRERIRLSDMDVKKN